MVLPLAWAFAIRLRDAGRPWAPAFGLFVCATVAANSHLFFPLTAAPGVVLIERSSVSWRRVAIAAIAILVGWLLSPYGLHWADVYRLNFEPHALYSSPSPVDEHTPGFSALARGGGSGLLVIPLLLALPWLTASRLESRARSFYGLLWAAGLVLFATAPGLLPWWLLTLPLTALALTLAAPATPIVVTTQRAVVAAIFGAMALIMMAEMAIPGRRPTLPSRQLPSSAASGIEPIANWPIVTRSRLQRGDCSPRSTSLRSVELPRLSESIDSRTIFPDSAAAAGVLLPVRRSLPLPPWQAPTWQSSR